MQRTYRHRTTRRHRTHRSTKGIALVALALALTGLALALPVALPLALAMLTALPDMASVMCLPLCVGVAGVALGKLLL